MKKTTTIAVWLVAAMCLASTAARPQETANSGVDVDDIFQQAVNSAGGGGGLPSIPGFEGGFPNNLGATENVQTPEFVSGHGSENVAEPDAETIGSQSPFFPEEENKEEWPSLSSPSHHELSPTLVPINEASPLPTEEVPLTSELLNHEISPTDSGQETMPPFDGTSNADLSSLSPFNFNPVQNFPAFGGSQTNHSQSLITGLWGLLNSAQSGNASAGGAGTGTVQNGSATGQGTGITNVGFGGFGIGLGIGGAIQTPLGNLAFGQGNGVAIGR